MVEREKTFYVLNPKGDLPRTEKSFAWFCGEEGWEGVVGRAPTVEETSTALKDKDIYM